MFVYRIAPEQPAKPKEPLAVFANVYQDANDECVGRACSESRDDVSDLRLTGCSYLRTARFVEDTGEVERLTKKLATIQTFFEKLVESATTDDGPRYRVPEDAEWLGRFSTFDLWWKNDDGTPKTDWSGKFAPVEMWRDINNSESTIDGRRAEAWRRAKARGLPTTAEEVPAWLEKQKEAAAPEKPVKTVWVTRDADEFSDFAVWNTEPHFCHDGIWADNGEGCGRIVSLAVLSILGIPIPAPGECIQLEVSVREAVRKDGGQ